MKTKKNRPNEDRLPVKNKVVSEPKDYHDHLLRRWWDGRLRRYELEDQKERQSETS